MTPEDNHQVFSNTRELAQQYLQRLGFEAPEYPWELTDIVLDRIADDFPEAKGNPYKVQPMQRLEDDLRALDALSTWTRIIDHLDPQSVPEDARGPLIDKQLPDAYWTAEEWYQNHRLG